MHRLRVPTRVRLIVRRLEERTPFPIRITELQTEYTEEEGLKGEKSKWHYQIRPRQYITASLEMP